MCSTAIFRGEHIHGMTRVREALGDDRVCTSEGYALSSYLMDGCLCPVDFRAMERWFDVEPDEHDSMQFHLREKTA